MKPCKRSSAAVLSVVAAAVLASCSNGELKPPAGNDFAPLAVGRPLALQRELLTSAHWEALAEDVAAKIAEQAKSIDDPKATYFVEPLDPAMPFSLAFREHLTDSLMRNGLPVSLSRDGSHRIHYQVRTINHEINSGRLPTGTFAVVTGTGLVLAKASRFVDNNAFNLLGLALLAEGANATKFGPLDEVVVTVSLVRGSDMYGRVSATYYVDRREAYQYAQTHPAPPLMMAEPVAEPALTSRSIPVVAE